MPAVTKASFVVWIVSFQKLIFLLCSLCWTGTIYGFNVGANKSVQEMAAKKNIPLKMHNVIYHLIDDLKEELGSKLPAATEENIIGEQSSCFSVFQTAFHRFSRV